MNSVTKKCETCNESKPLSDYYTAPADGAVAWTGTSIHCIECHSKGLVIHGYGYYGDKYKHPDWYVPNV